MFCKNCGTNLPEGSTFCPACGQQTDGALPAAPTVPPTGPAGARQSSTAKIVAIVLAVLVVFGGACGGIYVLQQQREQQRALQTVQTELTAAQQAAEQAQMDAEDARAEQEKAEAEAEKAAQEADKAKTDAKNAEKEANEAKNNAAVILAAIMAAQDGGDIAFDGYIFPSDRVYISSSDMAYWDQTIALLARNEIFARHGYVFETDYIQSYFAAQSWYSPDASYKGGNLSKVEQSNVDAILAYEKKKGWQ